MTAARRWILVLALVGGCAYQGSRSVAKTGGIMFAIGASIVMTSVIVHEREGGFSGYTTYPAGILGTVIGISGAILGTAGLAGMALADDAPSR